MRKKEKRERLLVVGGERKNERENKGERWRERECVERGRKKRRYSLRSP